jgi:hypothetical protein
MDNEFSQAEQTHPESSSAAAAPPAAVAETTAPADPATVIEQVRELLFGDHRRSTEGSLKGLEDRFAALTATVEARFADLERRLSETKAETDQARDSGVEAIGAAIAELGDKIKGLTAKHSS